MANQTTVRKSQIDRAIAAVRSAGLTVAEIITTRDSVRVITTDGMGKASGPKKNAWDEVLEDGAPD